MVILKIKIAATFHAFAPVPLKNSAARLARDWLTSPACAGSPAFLNVQEHVGPVETLR
jgi:hypothetical protein